MITSKSSEETQNLGKTWGENCSGGEIFALHGPLGAGKTQLVKGLALGLGYQGEVTSPTYTLIHEYLGGRLTLYHLDLYRLDNAEAGRRLGLEEYFTANGVVVIEWPEKIREFLPATTRHFEFRIAGETERKIVELGR